MKSHYIWKNIEVNERIDCVSIVWEVTSNHRIGWAFMEYDWNSLIATRANGQHPVRGKVSLKHEFWREFRKTRQNFRRTKRTAEIPAGFCHEVESVYSRI